MSNIEVGEYVRTKRRRYWKDTYILWKRWLL